MSQTLGPKNADQLDLFHPPRNVPTWRGLPREVQQKTVSLLVQLLRERHQRGPAPGSGKGAGHE